MRAGERWRYEGIGGNIRIFSLPAIISFWSMPDNPFNQHLYNAYNPFDLLRVLLIDVLALFDLVWPFKTG